MSSSACLCRAASSPSSFCSRYARQQARAHWCESLLKELPVVERVSRCRKSLPLCPCEGENGKKG